MNNIKQRNIKAFLEAKLLAFQMHASPVMHTALRETFNDITERLKHEN